MAPLPKRKHSTMRKGKRLKARKVTFPQLVICVNCKKMKLSHIACHFCHS